MKKLSCGTILTDGKNILLGHVTGKDKYDLPKGGHEEKETYLQTAQRELLEEFGIHEPGFRFQDLGFYEYTVSKDLYLYLIEYPDIKQDIPLSTLFCTSYFDRNGEQILEIDGYNIISIKEIPNYCYPNMVKVLKKILPF